MITVSNATKAAWLDETSYKEYEVLVYYGGETWTYNNDTIKRDSINISAAIMQSNKIEFGGCIARKLDIIFDGPRNISGDSNDRWRLTLRARANATEWISLFSGTTISCKREPETGLIRYEAYDAFYDLANMDITSWYNSYSGWNQIGTVFNSFLTETGLPARLDCHFANELETVALGGLSNPVNSLSALDFIKQLCQMNCCFGEIDGGGYFRTVNIDPEQTAEEIDVYDSYTKGGMYYSVSSIVFKPTSEAESVRYPTAPISNDDAYVIQDNVLTLNSLSSELSTFGQNDKNNLTDVAFRAFSANQLARPWLECGDKVSYFDDEEIHEQAEYIILSRTFSGDQFAKDSYSASLDETLGPEENTTLNTTSKPRTVQYSTADIVEGTTRLATGNLYLVYE